MGSNCWQQLVLRAVLLLFLLTYVHGLLGLSDVRARCALGVEIGLLAARNVRLRRRKAQRRKDE